MASRSQRRQERYQLLRRLGYSATDARRLRDRSGDNIDTDISRTERRLARTPAEDRSEQTQARLRTIRDYKRERRTMPAEARSKVESRSQRVRNFREWSVSRDFPPGVVAEIQRINREAGFGPFNSYGFRVWYHMYVNRESEALSKRRFNSERFERRDT